MTGTCVVALLTLGLSGPAEPVAKLGMDGKWVVQDWNKLAATATISSRPGQCWAREIMARHASLPTTDHLDDTCPDDPDAVMKRIGDADPVLQACIGQ